MLIIIVISACFAYFGVAIGMYLVLIKFDKDTDSDNLRCLSVCWPLWVGLIPIIGIGRAFEIIFEKIDEDIVQK